MIKYGTIVLIEKMEEWKWQKRKEKKEKNKKAGNKQGIQFQIQSKIGASIIVVRAVIAVLVVVVVYNLLIKANNTELRQDSEAISLQVEKYFLPFERMVEQLALDEDVQTILTTTKDREWGIPGGTKEACRSGRTWHGKYSGCIHGRFGQ